MITAAPLEIWGGVECSVVRIGSTVRNQLQDTGHWFRSGDIDLIANLGIKKLRYPVLWELVEQSPSSYNWTWTDERLTRLRKAGIAPIAGFIHHGSGPLWTDILHAEFPRQLAVYAEKVAQRYPWIELFNPVNEPVTTARISGLYGLWHPHKRDNGTFLRLVVAESLAIAAAMKALRRVTASAQLVQTEDFGRVFSTELLEYQASYENERRWLGIDLLAGKVDRHHPLRGELLAAGVDPFDLDTLLAEPCVPDIVGIDYYLTSDRMLDERSECYPDEAVNGNGRHAYVDAAAVRANVPANKIGLGARVEEVWNRYQLPMVVTELHNGCTRDEQLRWLMQGWNEAGRLRKRGIDVRAVTSWSLFGATDWNSMLVRNDGFYECGAFDARCSPPQPTVVAEAMAELAKQGSFDHPALDQPGWWLPGSASHAAARPIVLTGFSHLVSVIEECCSKRRLRVVPSGSESNTAQLLRHHGAWAVIRTDPSGGAGRQPFRIICDFAGGGRISFDLAHWNDWTTAINGFLDLMIDRRHHNFELNLVPQMGTLP